MFPHAQINHRSTLLKALKQLNFRLDFHLLVFRLRKKVTKNRYEYAPDCSENDKLPDHPKGTNVYTAVDGGVLNNQPYVVQRFMIEKVNQINAYQKDLMLGVTLY